MHDWVCLHSAILTNFPQLHEDLYTFLHSTIPEGQTEISVYHVKVVETKLGSIKANQRIVWSELMTLLKNQQSSVILKKENRQKMNFSH